MKPVTTINDRYTMYLNFISSKLNTKTPADFNGRKTLEFFGVQESAWRYLRSEGHVVKVGAGNKFAKYKVVDSFYDVTPDMILEWARENRVSTSKNTVRQLKVNSHDCKWQICIRHNGSNMNFWSKLNCPLDAIKQALSLDSELNANNLVFIVAA